MLSAEQKKKLEEEILSMESSGDYTSDEIDAFILEVNKKHGGTSSEPAKEEKKFEPNVGDALAPNTGRAIRDFDSKKEKEWKVDKSQPDFIDAPGGKIFNHKKYENPERVKLTEGVMGGLFNDAFSFLPRAAGTVAGKMGKSDVSKGEVASVKEYMADPNTHVFKGRKEQNFKDFANGTGPGRYIDLVQGIGVDAAGDPLSYAPWAWPAKYAKIAQEINLVNKAAKGAGGITKGMGRYLSGIRGRLPGQATEEVIDDLGTVGKNNKRGDVDVLEHAAKEGIDKIENSKSLGDLFADVSDLSKAEKAKLDKALQAGREDIAADVLKKSDDLKAKKDLKHSEFETGANTARDELITDIPGGLSRETKEKVFQKYNEITEPIEKNVRVDLTQSEFNPLKVIDGHHKYGTPEFEKWKTGLKKEIEERLFRGNNEYELGGKATAAGEQILQEKKLFQDLAQGTFGEVTDAQKTVYKDVARAYREALEDAAVKGGNPEYIETMRKKAGITQTMKDATKSFLPKNISSDLEVSEKVRKAVGKLDKSPETMEKLTRLDNVLREHGVDLGLSQKASDLVRYNKGMDNLKRLVGKGESMEDALKAMDEIDPGFAKSYRDDLQALRSSEESSKGMGRIRDVGDQEMLEKVRKNYPDIAEDVSEKLSKADIAERGKKSITDYPSQYKSTLAERDMNEFDKAFPEVNLKGQYSNARAKSLLKADANDGKIPWFDVNLTGKAAGNLALGALTGGGAKGAIAGAIASSPRAAVRMFQFANGLDKLTTGPVLDKLIAAAETGGAASVIRWLTENGYIEDSENK